MTAQRLARNATFSVAQVVLSAAALLISYWLLMRALPVDQIGLWSLIVGSTAIARLSEMGLGSGTLRFVAGDIGAGDPARAARSVGMAAAVVAVVAGFAAVVLHPLLLGYLLTITPPTLADAVRLLLPAALGAVAVGAIGNVFLSAIDGCQRMDWRASLQIVSSLVQLAAIWFVLPRWGLAGLGWVQLAQAGVLALGAMIGTAWLLRRPLRDYCGFELARLKAMLGYGGGLQLSAIAQLLFEPLLKVWLTAWSGLALTGYFDMATRIVQQFRAVVVAAYGALVPHVAADRLADAARLKELYRGASTLLITLLLPYWAGVAAVLPLALTLWKGQFDSTFLAVTLLQFAAWGLNLLNTVAYMLYVGLGRLRWTIASHLLIGAIVLVAGPLLGKIAGGPGVLLAGALALVTGSLLVLWRFHREFTLDWRDLVGAEQIRAAALLLIAVGVSLGFALRGETPGWAALTALPVIVWAIAALLLWRSPVRAQVLAQLHWRQ